MQESQGIRERQAADDPERKANVKSRKALQRHYSWKSRQKKSEGLQKALEQFQRDYALCRYRQSKPLVALPKKPKAEDVLTVENIKAVLAKPCFIERVKNINSDALIKFVVHDSSVVKGNEHKRLFVEKIKEYFDVKDKDCTATTINYYDKLRQSIRNCAWADKSRAYRQQLLDSCAQMRAEAKKLEQQLSVCLSSVAEANTVSEANTVPEADTELNFGHSIPDFLLPVIASPALPVQETVEQESQHEPMNTEETPELSMEELLLQNSANLYPLLQKKRGYYLLDGLPYTQFLMPEKIRDRFISSDLKDRLSMKDRWKTGRYFELEPVEDSSAFSELIKQAQNDLDTVEEYPLGVALTGAGDDEQVLSWDVEKTTNKKNETSELKVVLHKVSQGSEQKTLALYNSDEEKDVNVILGKQKVYKLKPESAVLLQPRTGRNKKNLIWTPVTEYRKGKYQTEETNPLIRDLPRPVESADSGENEWSREGEYFLSPEVVSDLAGRKSKTNEKPAICHRTADVRKALQKAFGKDNQQTGATSLIYCNKASNHTVAVRVLRKDGKALVYINETLEPTSALSDILREEILNAARPFFKNVTLSCVYPGDTAQLDFSSCGVFTYKAIRAFDKWPAMDEWLWSQGQKPERVLHQAGEYDKWDDLPLTGCFVPLKEMPPQLLKCFQGDEKLLSKDQLDTYVSHKKKRKLGQYLVDHQPFQALRNGYKANLSATGKRYKYLVQWQKEFLEKSIPSDPVLVRDMQRTGDALTEEECQLVTRFHPIIDVGDPEEANTWLKAHLPGVAEVKESDWEMNCTFEDFVYDEKSLSLEKARDLDAWLENALTNPDDRHHQLMLAWCIYIKQSQKSHFTGVSLRDIQGALRKFIEVQKKPVAMITGFKYYNPE